MSPLQDPDSPYYLISGDHFGTLIVSDKLVGESNYFTWANDMCISLVSRRKLLFINGKITMPVDKNSKEYDT